MTRRTDALPMEQGLTAALLPLGPAMWHDFALSLDWAAPGATVDLLLAADAVTRRPDCDRATAALILARCLGAGFHRGDVPAGFVPEAARAFTIRLQATLAAGRFAVARFGLPPAALRLVQQELGPRGPLPMPPLAFGSHEAEAPFAHDAGRLYPRARALRRAG